MNQNKNNLSITTKLYSFFIVFIALFFINDYRYIAFLSLICFLFLISQKKYSLVISFFIFYIILLALILGIRLYSLRVTILPKFYIFLLWNLLPIMVITWDLITTPPGEISAFLSKAKMPIFIILGVLVVFRFFPTMKAEMKRIINSMKNRNLLTFYQIVRHPIFTFEYALVPLLIRSMQIADQLSISAITRGALSSNVRSSYYEKKMKHIDYAWFIGWFVVLSISVIVRSVGIW